MELRITDREDGAGVEDISEAFSGDITSKTGGLVNIYFFAAGSHSLLFSVMDRY